MSKSSQAFCRAWKHKKHFKCFSLTKFKVNQSKKGLELRRVYLSGLSAHWWKSALFISHDLSWHQATIFTQTLNLRKHLTHFTLYEIKPKQRSQPFVNTPFIYFVITTFLNYVHFQYPWCLICKLKIGSYKLVFFPDNKSFPNVDLSLVLNGSKDSFGLAWNLFYGF
jgi:hypothetical protein